VPVQSVRARMYSSSKHIRIQFIHMHSRVGIEYRIYRIYRIKRTRAVASGEVKRLTNKDLFAAVLNLDGEAAADADI
jgi:hypothetical protein